MKKLPSVLGHAARLLMALAAALTVSAARGAGSYTLSTTNDSHASNPGGSANDSTGHVSLRSAVEAANAQSGSITINVPAGTYNLTLGEIDLAPNGGQTNFIAGAGAAGTMVIQMDPTNRVFNVDSNSRGRTVTTFSGLTIQGGHDGADGLGGAGLLAGSITNVQADVLSLSNCVVQNNHCTTATTWEPGGGVQMAGGILNITSCTFSNNSSGQSFGGAIFVLAQSVVSPLNVANSTFVNNSLTNLSGAGPDGGGGIMIETPAGTIHSVTACTFINNRAVGASGDACGGAIQLNTGTLNIGGSTFVTNAATGSGGRGGAIFADAGTINMSFCRLVGNTASNGGGALYNHGSNGANSHATNNWWGCNLGPGASGCDVAMSDNEGTLVFFPWLTLNNTANPPSIDVGQSATLTASVLQNSAYQTLTPAQVAVLIGLPVSWSAVNGGISNAQAVIQSTGQATATFTNSTCGPASANVSLDNGTATANLTVLCPDLTITKTNDANGTVVLGQSWTWIIHIANAGPAPASFSGNEPIVVDDLPTSGLNYGSPLTVYHAGISPGSVAGNIDGNKNLDVVVLPGTSLNAGGSFDIEVEATPLAVGTYGNPRTGGVCVVNPSGEVAETNYNNNSASNSVVVTCPAITGNVSGNSNICPGSSAIVTVTVSGGVPPYTVTLNNGGGTQSGSGPLLFTVTPAATTTYQISSGSDSEGCPISAGGSATMTLNTPPAPPVITLSPPSVLANSAGNQASVSGGAAGYAWTISNGAIIGPASQPVVTYAAGGSNTVVLGLTVFNATGCNAGNAVNVPVITGFSAHTNITFTDALSDSSMPMAFDGTNYWSCSGGTTNGARLAAYGLSGTTKATYAPGLDFRSLMTEPNGTLLARAFDNPVIYVMASPGVFTNSGITLTGGSLDPQSSVVLNGAATEFDAMSGGVVSRWDTNGAYLGSVLLTGFGSLAGESGSPQDRGLAALGNFWLTYNGAGVVSIWDTNGNRLTQLALPGAGASNDSEWSFSYCNGKVFIVDVAGGTWRGFNLFAGASVAVLAAESQNTYNSDVTNKIASVGSLPRVDLFQVASGPIPTLAQLRSYQSVMIFSDDDFSDPVALGNVLADYIDQGGGAVLQTFAFTTSPGLGPQGRVSTNGYLPFNLESYSYPVSLTMVEELPQNPLLDGVVSFTGGTGSFQNSPVTNTPGTTAVAEWSNGQPLVGGKDDRPGRCAGLNFFPASSDSISAGWVASTDGAKLMANALLWAGRIPPTILAAPTDQVLPQGATASFTVHAAGTSPLSYQWRLNGNNLTSATNSSLGVTVEAGTAGAYSVVVSNLYGATTSLNAELNPQLRFLPPAITGGPFSLYLVNADGSAVAASRAARVTLYATTNLASPWLPLTNAVVPGGGELRADGFSATNGFSQFFQAVEAP